jgi:hypothetical protein
MAKKSHTKGLAAVGGHNRRFQAARPWVSVAAHRRKAGESLPPAEVVVPVATPGLVGRSIGRLSMAVFFGIIETKAGGGS